MRLAKCLSAGSDILFRVACQPVNMSAPLENIKMMAIGHQFNIGALYNCVTNVTFPSKLIFFLQNLVVYIFALCEKRTCSIILLAALYVASSSMTNCLVVYEFSSECN